VADADAIRRLIAIVSAQAARFGAAGSGRLGHVKVTNRLLKMTADASRGGAGRTAGVDGSPAHLAAVGHWCRLRTAPP
jgi:hypothetical protein